MPHKEEWYVWKELAKDPDKECSRPRLITPWSNPRTHEFPFSDLYDSPEAAKKGLEFDGDPEAGWLLCKMTLEVVE